MSTNKHLIIGIGSPFGDDRAGWLVIEHLQRMALPAQLTLKSLDRPGPELIGQMQGFDQVTLIDAVRAHDQSVGICLPLDLSQLMQQDSCSSHGFGLAHTLTLAQALGQLPPRLQLWGICIDDRLAGESVSKEVIAAARHLAQQLSGLA